MKILISARFFIHLGLQAFAEALLDKFGEEGEKAILFPSSEIARQCQDFVTDQAPIEGKTDLSLASEVTRGIRILNLTLRKAGNQNSRSARSTTVLSVVIVPQELYLLATKFWQHSGDGVSSRCGEFFHKAFAEGYLVPHEEADDDKPSTKVVLKGPRRYQKGKHIDSEKHKAYATDSFPGRDSHDYNAEFLQFVEERFGRNLDTSSAACAKLAIRRRIAGTLTADVESGDSLRISDEASSTRREQLYSVEDVYLWPTGMSAIYNTHRMLLGTRGPMKSVMFG